MDVDLLDMIYAALRAVRFGFQDTWRNFWLSLITTSTMVLTLLTVSLVIGLHVGIAQIVRAAEERIDLAVYFYPAATESQVTSVATALRTMPGVVEITTVTREQALARYQERAADSPELLAPLTAIGQNPFGPSLVVKADSPAAYARVVEELAKLQYRDLVEGQRKDFEENRAFIDAFSAFTDRVRFSGLVASGLLAFLAALLIFNAIRVAIYTHREEIAIMKLVGATNWFVRSPFLAAIVLYSLAAIAVSAGLFFSFLYFLQPYLDRYFMNDVNLLGYFQANGLAVFGLELAFILVLNIMSGSLALRRYLRI